MSDADRDLIVVERPGKLPEAWDYSEGVKKFRNLSRDVRVHGAEALEEVRNAHYFLYEDSKRKKGRKWPGKTWGSWCEDVGYSERTCRRWLEAYFPDYYERFQQKRVKDALLTLKEDGSVEGLGAMERRPPRGYVRPAGELVIEKGVDPFAKPKGAPDRWKVVRRLSWLFDKYLTQKQAMFARLHFLHGQTPEQVAAHHAKVAGKDPLTADGVHRALKRIRWLITRRYVFLCVYKMHKRLREDLTQDEYSALEGWVEAERYVFRGSEKEL